MYLWLAHNRVNARLVGDVTEDPSFPKQQFPADFLCSQCGTGNSRVRNNAVYNRDATLSYLSRYYTNLRPAPQ